MYYMFVNVLYVLNYLGLYLFRAREKNFGENDVI